MTAEIIPFPAKTHLCGMSGQTLARNDGSPAWCPRCRGWIPTYRSSEGWDAYDPHQAPPHEPAPTGKATGAFPPR